MQAMTTPKPPVMSEVVTVTALEFLLMPVPLLVAVGRCILRSVDTQFGKRHT